MLLYVAWTFLLVLEDHNTFPLSHAFSVQKVRIPTPQRLSIRFLFTIYSYPGSDHTSQVAQQLFFFYNTQVGVSGVLSIEDFSEGLLVSATTDLYQSRRPVFVQGSDRPLPFVAPLASCPAAGDRRN